MSLLSPFRKTPEKLTNKAAELKMNRDWLRAGDKFLEAAALLLKERNELDAIKCLTDAASSFAQIDGRYAIMANSAAADIYANRGQMSYAGQVHTRIAKMALKLARGSNDSGQSWLVLGSPLDRQRLTQLTNIGAKTFRTAQSASDLAIEHYRLAADRYEAEGSLTNVIDCMAQCAEVLADTGEPKNLELAAQTFIDLAGKAAGHDVLAMGARRYALRACLCWLALGHPLQTLREELGRAISTKLRGMRPPFARSEEFTFVETVATAADTADRKSLEDERMRFHQLYGLDDWENRRLKTVKERVIALRLAKSKAGLRSEQWSG